MRNHRTAWLLIVIAALTSSGWWGAAQQASAIERLLGTWTGRWEADDRSGGFEMTLEQGKDGAVGGRVSVTGDPTYTAALKEVAFDGTKLSAKYDFTPDESAEVALLAIVDGDSAKGTWSLRVKASGSEVASGAWNVTKK